MSKNTKKCENCGHDCHCGGSCKREVVTEFNEKHEIECCGHCRHKTNTDFDEDEVKYDSMDHDSFNGA